MLQAKLLQKIQGKCDNQSKLTLSEAISIYSKLEKCFSKYNVYLCRLADKIRKIATVEEKYELAADYAESTLVAFKYLFVLSFVYVTLGEAQDVFMAVQSQRCQVTSQKKRKKIEVLIYSLHHQTAV